MSKKKKSVVYWLVGQKILATTQRVASASMAEALGPAGTRPEVRRMSKREAFVLRQGKDYEIVIWIRDPYDRLACAYPIWKNSSKYTFGELSPNSFAKKVMRETNPHFTPQCQLHSVPDIGFLPTRVYAYDNLAETWPQEFGNYKLPYYGAQPERMQTEQFMDKLEEATRIRLRAHYSMDELYHMVALANPGIQIHDQGDAPYAA